jgi:hypothetical protein
VAFSHCHVAALIAKRLPSSSSRRGFVVTPGALHWGTAFSVRRQRRSAERKAFAPN